ncbi:transmembrane protein, putative [Medicago truncatula]|uniref:Transmembrane protein, putative n=1 Tax=Medicago truncatula TaxID=3880 RepID=A0A072UWA6_MEDTR|nr:transmembrane protein, putative [Medicago truncatula]
MTNLVPYDLAPLQTYLGWLGGIGLGPGSVLLFKVKVSDDFLDCRLSQQTNPNLFSVFCSHSHALRETFQKVAVAVIFGD